MGLLIEGEWHDQWYDTKHSKGRFVRQESQFRHWIEADPQARFPAESGRYHLYVSYACPWAHRTLIYRALKGLQEHISVSVVHPLMHENGWTFQAGDKVVADPMFHADYMHQVYTAVDPQYTGRVTVPVLLDKHTQTAVSNESSEIIRMFNQAFNGLSSAPELDLAPQALLPEIDALNERIYHTVNNGVYKSGFASTQEAYEEAVTALFETLDMLEERLSQQRYLLGHQITEADWRLFPTLVRFDPVYVGHFKCNIRRLQDYPHLWGYMLDLYQQPNIAETVHMDHIKTHYYASHKTVNPTGIVPVGPDIDLMASHGREKFC